MTAKKLVRKNCVAVECCSKTGPDYKYVLPKNAPPARIVRCSYDKCTNPAVFIDPLFPYHQEYNRCEEHLTDVMQQLLKTKVKRTYAKCAGYPALFDAPPRMHK